MTILRDGLARCLFPGCPVRFVSGGSRLCGDHAEETAATWAQRLAELAPGDRADDGADASSGT